MTLGLLDHRYTAGSAGYNFDVQISSTFWITLQRPSLREQMRADMTTTRGLITLFVIQPILTVRQQD